MRFSHSVAPLFSALHSELKMGLYVMQDPDTIRGPIWQQVSSELPLNSNCSITWAVQANGCLVLKSLPRLHAVSLLSLSASSLVMYCGHMQELRLHPCGAVPGPQAVHHCGQRRRRSECSPEHQRRPAGLPRLHKWKRGLKLG